MLCWAIFQFLLKKVWYENHFSVKVAYVACKVNSPISWLGKIWILEETVFGCDDLVLNMITSETLLRKEIDVEFYF